MRRSQASLYPNWLRNWKRAPIGFGELDRLITLQDVIDTQDPVYNEPTEVWWDTVTIRAAVKPLSGSEYFLADQTSQECESVFWIHWRAGVTAKTRISWEGRIYDIVRIEESGRRRWLGLYAKARVE